MSASERIIGNLAALCSLFFSYKWRWRLSKASRTLIAAKRKINTTPTAPDMPSQLMRTNRTLSLKWLGKWPEFSIESIARSAICPNVKASASNKTAPFKIKLRNSNSEWSDKVATWGFDQRLPPSSTSSSNLTQLSNIKHKFNHSWTIYLAAIYDY